MIKGTNIKKYPTCEMRHKNGNCQPVGGFCTTIQKEICEAMHNAWDMGFLKCCDTYKEVAKMKEIRRKR